jgi:dipeptidyl-peptidase 4
MTQPSGVSACQWLRAGAGARRLKLVWFAAILFFIPAALPGRALRSGGRRLDALGPQRSPQAAAPRQLTLERIYSEPSLSGTLMEEVDWSPDAKTVSYLRPSGDSDEFWLLDLSTGRQRMLLDAKQFRALVPSEFPPTQRTGIGRVHPRHYLWSPAGHALLFISPTTLAWYDLETGAHRWLVTGKAPLIDPKVSPDDRWVSFARNDNLWVVNVASGRETALTTGGSESLRDGRLDWVYPEELAIYTAYWWSPDSSRLAYLQLDEHPVTRYPLVNYLSPTDAIQWTRYPTAGSANPIARLGVVSVRGGRTRWMDTGRDADVYLARVAWLPNSKELAIERLNRAQTRLDLLLTDAATGRSRTVLTDTDKYWINLSDDLYLFRDSKRLLWSSERSGFRHLYLYDTSGRLLRQLTSGDWEVTKLAGVDEKQGLVYFVATKKSVLERQLYRVALDGSGLAPITRAPGTHEITMPPEASTFLDEYSNAMTPPRQEIDRADGTRLAVLDANPASELAEYHLSPVEFLTVPAADGTPLQAMMIKPPDFDPARKYPVLIFVYGGPTAQLVRDQWGKRRFLWHELMAERGYIIFSLDNRGSEGRGHAFETPLYHHFGSVELADQLAGVRYLRSLSYVDPARIGIWGWSYGGYMTLEAMLRAPDVFKAGVAVAPVTDWRMYDTIYTERYMGTPEENPEGYKDSSPVTYAAQLRGKLLIAHGTGDDNVHFANTAELVEKFIQAGHYTEVMIFPGRGHPISDTPAELELFRRMRDFLLHNL